MKQLLVLTLYILGISIVQQAMSPTVQGQSIIDTLPVPLGPSYEVDFSDVINQYITVTMTAESTAETAELMMPVWTPGSYMIREYAKHIDSISAVAEDGQQLPIEKISKNRWVVTTQSPRKFSVQYRLFCNGRSVRENFVNHNFAVLNGTAAFVTVDGQLDRPHAVTLKLPEHWKKSATSLIASHDAPHSYRADDYDELVDSPIVAGLLNKYEFEVGGIKHYLVNVNEMGYWDGAAVALDLVKIVQQHHKFWGNVPYSRYYFLNVINNRGGGLEHNNSCLLMTSRWRYRNESSYRGWLTLASHEFFHTWNVRRVRPKALLEYDYESEVYTPSLWIAEGVTSYYEDLLLVRAGLISRERFISGLSRLISKLQRTEGRHVQSLRDASHDAWIKFYRPEANDDETTISYYSKGAIVAFLLDAEIRAASQDQHSLDDVMRDLFQKYNDSGFLPADFRKLCSHYAGRDLSGFFERSVDSTQELDYQTAANWFGLQFGEILPRHEPDVEPVDSADDKTSKPTSKPTPWIGVGVSGSPASKAGLASSDEVLAVNDMRASSVESRLRQFEVGESIKVLVARDDQLLEIIVTIGQQPPTPDWGMQIFKDASEEQSAHLDNLFAE